MAFGSCCTGGAWGQELKKSGQISEGHFGSESEAPWEVGKVSTCVVSNVTWA